MNRKELEQALKNMTREEFSEFIKVFGGDHKTYETVVRAYVDRPDLERRLCQLLDIPTEDEKLMEATLNAAKSSKRAATVAVISTIIAFLSLLTTVVLQFWPGP